MTTIRQATSSTDFREAERLLRDYIQWVHEAAGFDPYEAQPDLRDEVANLAAHYGNPQRVLFVAEIDGCLAGTLGIRLHRDGSSELKRMYVVPGTRGGGIADLLIATALDYAQNGGSHVTWLESMRGVMERAIAVYRRNGFEEVPEPTRTLPVDGVIVMERSLLPMRQVA